MPLGWRVLGQLVLKLFEQLRPSRAQWHSRCIVEHRLVEIASLVVDDHDSAIVEPWFLPGGRHGDGAGHAPGASSNDDHISHGHPYMVGKDVIMVALAKGSC